MDFLYLSQIWHVLSFESIYARKIVAWIYCDFLEDWTKLRWFPDCSFWLSFCDSTYLETGLLVGTCTILFPDFFYIDFPRICRHSVLCCSMSLGSKNVSQLVGNVCAYGFIGCGLLRPMIQNNSSFFIPGKISARVMIFTTVSGKLFRLTIWIRRAYSKLGWQNYIFVIDSFQFTLWFCARTPINPNVNVDLSDIWPRFLVCHLVLLKAWQLANISAFPWWEWRSDSKFACFHQCPPLWGS